MHRMCVLDQLSTGAGAVLICRQVFLLMYSRGMQAGTYHQACLQRGELWTPCCPVCVEGVVWRSQDDTDVSLDHAALPCACWKVCCSNVQ
jgi:hypothetical protein